MSNATVAHRRRRGVVGAPARIGRERLRRAFGLRQRGDDRVRLAFGAGQREKDALSGERVDEARSVADQDRTPALGAPHLVRERTDRDARPQPRCSGKRAHAVRELRRGFADAGVDVARPLRQPLFGHHDHHVGIEF